VKDLERGVEFIYILQFGDSRLELYLAIPDSYSTMSLFVDFLSAIIKNFGPLPQSLTSKSPVLFLVPQDKASYSISLPFISWIITHLQEFVLVDSTRALILFHS
jgi:hypothetical protein